MVRVQTFIFLAVGMLVIAAGYIVFAVGIHKSASAWGQILVSSPTFANGGKLPIAMTCDGSNMSPQLQLKNIPSGTQSIAIDLVEVSDSYNQADWIMWNLSPNIKRIPANAGPAVGMIGVNDAGQNSYSGPCPAQGTHHYRYEAYALDTILDLPQTAAYTDMQQAMKTHVLGYGSLTVAYARASGAQ